MTARVDMESTLAETFLAAKRELDEAKARFNAISAAIKAEGIERINVEGRSGQLASSCRIGNVQVARRAVLRASVVDTVEDIGARIGLDAAETLFEPATKVKLHSPDKLLSLLRAFGIPYDAVCDVTETVKPVQGYWAERKKTYLNERQLEALEEFERAAFTEPQVYEAKLKTKK